MQGVPAMIPNVFHFCYGFTRRAEFGFLEYLAIKSAREINRPREIYLHYRHECRGPWWQRAKRLVRCNRIEVPSQIFGRPLWHYAHQSDVVRLMILHEQGGIYLDIDTLCVRPLAELCEARCVMGQQAGWGLCNAVILSQPNGAFIRSWIDCYRTFRSTGHDEHWDEHSVRLPRRLAEEPELRGQITVLGPRAFFFPLWHEMQCLFESGDASLFADSYCIHYWETLTRQRWLRHIDPATAAQGNSNFGALRGTSCSGEAHR